MIDFRLPDDVISDAEIYDSFSIKRKRGPEPKTHCKRGHAFTQENTKFIHGRRYCLECQRERDRQYKARKRSAAAAIGESK